MLPKPSTTPGLPTFVAERFSNRNTCYNTNSAITLPYRPLFALFARACLFGPAVERRDFKGVYSVAQAMRLPIVHRNRLFRECLVSALSDDPRFEVNDVDQTDLDRLINDVACPLFRFTHS